MHLKVTGKGAGDALIIGDKANVEIFVRYSSDGEVYIEGSRKKCLHDSEILAFVSMDKIL